VALLGRLTENLSDASGNCPHPPLPHQGAYSPANMLVPGMLARDRIFGRFLPATAGMIDTAGLLQGNLGLLQPAWGVAPLDRSWVA